MMKKIIALILAGIMAAGMTAPAAAESDGDRLGEYLNEILPKKLSEENVDMTEVIREYADMTIPFSLATFGLNGEYDISEPFQIHNWDGGEDTEKYMVIVSENNVMVASLTAERIGNRLANAFREESIPAINDALASGAEIRLGYSHDCFLVYTQGKLSVVENPYFTDESFVAQLELELARQDKEKDDLSAEEQNLIALAEKDHDEAVRYYRENLIVPGVYGSYIPAEGELSLLSGKALICFDKSAGEQAEDQLFRLYVYTDQEKRYMIKISARTRSLYTAAELLGSIPEDEKPVFAAFHYQSYEYADEKVSIRISEYAEPWTEINGSRYYIRSDGTVQAKSAVIDGIRYRFGEDGVCRGRFTGITKSDRGRRYWKDGTLVKSRWLRVKGARKYYAGADGYFVTGTVEIGGKKYDFEKNGALKN